MLCLYNNCCFLKSCKVKHFFSFSMLFILNLLFEKYHKTDKFKKKTKFFCKTYALDNKSIIFALRFRT